MTLLNVVSIFKLIQGKNIDEQRISVFKMFIFCKFDFLLLDFHIYVNVLVLRKIKILSWNSLFCVVVAFSLLQLVKYFFSDFERKTCFCTA